MSSELLDYKAQENFDFFRFSVLLTDEDKKEQLREDSQEVLELAHAAVQDICLLGLKLKKIKESGIWEKVFNPRTGYTFQNHSFQEFCEYAYGLSNTRTSNLLRISEFVRISNAGNGSFIDSKYEKYNTSQLVELAAVPSYHRHYFTEKMTVADMRLAKDYMKNGYFFADRLRDGFDIMTYAKAYKEKKEKKEAPTSPAVLPGQTSFSEMFAEAATELEESEELEEALEAPAEDLVEDPLPDLMEGSSSAKSYYAGVTTEAEVNEYNEFDDEEEEDLPEEDPMESEEPEEEPTSTLKTTTFPYDFSNRDGIRDFYARYNEWPKIPCFPAYAFSLYGVDFRNKMSIWAIENKSASSMETMESDGTKVRYLWQNKSGDVFEITKLDLERYIMAHRNEL